MSLKHNKKRMSKEKDNRKENVEHHILCPFQVKIQHREEPKAEKI